MGEVEEVQEQMKADTEALKEKMATMMGAMMSIKEIMEVSAAYRTRARARVMGEVEEVQEQMKADMEAMKEQMATMMEAMMSMK